MSVYSMTGFGKGEAAGTNYTLTTEIKTVNNTIPVDARDTQIQDFKTKFPEQKIKAVRVTAKNLGKCPVGHPGEKQAAWLFVDEIIVE